MRKIFCAFLIAVIGFLPFAINLQVQASNGYAYDTEVYDLTQEDHDSEDLTEALLVSLMALWMVFVPAFLAVYVYRSFTLMNVAKKLDEPDAWFAWIPILNLILIFKLGERSPFYLLLLLLPGIGQIAIYIMEILAYMHTSERMGRDRMLGLLKIIPMGELILLGILNWGTSNTKKKEAK